MKQEHYTLARKVQAIKPDADGDIDADAVAEASRAFAVALGQISDKPMKRSWAPDTDNLDA